MKPTSSRERNTSSLAKYSIRSRLDEYMARLRLPGAWQSCAFAFLTSIYDRSGSDQSLYSYHGILCQFFACGLHPNEVTKTDIETYINRASVGRGREGRPIAAATRNHRLTVLSSFYSYASTYHVEGKPLYNKPSPVLGLSYGQPDIDPVSLTAEDLEELFSAIPTTTVRGVRDRAIFLCFFWTCARRSELCHMCVGDIQPATLTDAQGARRSGYVYQCWPKGHARQVATAELPMPAYNAIHAYWQYSGRLDSLKPDDAVFAPTKNSGPHKASRAENFLNADYINLSLKMYVHEAGLNERISLHALRHTGARIRYEMGSDIRAIQHVLRHSSIATTDRYIRVLAGESDPGAALLEKRFGALGAMG